MIYFVFCTNWHKYFRQTFQECACVYILIKYLSNVPMCITNGNNFYLFLLTSNLIHFLQYSTDDQGFILFKAIHLIKMLKKKVPFLSFTTQINLCCTGLKTMAFQAKLLSHCFSKSDNMVMKLYKMLLQFSL